MGVVLTEAELPLWAHRVREQGFTIVSTNGCFDLLHMGHVRYLQAAKQFGQRLVVALNSDASVQRLKGPTRPIIQEGDRAELLTALSCVDAVVVFTEDTPAEILKVLKPDIHVKGGDYTEETLPEAPLLKSLGAKMQFIPMTEGRSTSSLIERIQSLPSGSPVISVGSSPTC